MSELNRFDYFSDIEDKFVELRGSHLLMSNLDWELMQQWKNDGVPLHVVIAAIEEVFKKRSEVRGQRSVSSLRYCKPAVERKFQEWKAGRVGAHESEPGAVATGSNDPFSKEAVTLHLLERHRWISSLYAIRLADCGAADVLAEALLQAAADLTELAHRFGDGQVNARQLEESMQRTERALDAAIATVVCPELVAEARAAAEALLSPYQGKMPPKVYEQQIDAALKKRLREIFGVPRLSLFHMKG